MSAADELFGGPPSDRESYVLGQAVPFNPDRWIAGLPVGERWPDRLNGLPRAGRWPTVDRQTVFEAARRDAAAPEGGRDLLLSALVCGTGINAWGVSRRTRIFRENDPSRLDERMDLARAEVDRGDPVAAYRVLNDPHGRVKYLGPAFFTKFLYFATAGRPAGGRWPLIIDRNVVRALGDLLGGEEWVVGRRWDPATCARYLDRAHAWAERWGIAPDVVERKLFDHGRRLGSGKA
ncbi:8-oxoguanine DNA glycosylase OGG fold protein [Streptomyces sp. NPDC001770]